MIITIDGPAAAGKGTLAAALAKRYRLAYFDTGMVYRAVGLEMILEGLDVQNEEAGSADGIETDVCQDDGAFRPPGFSQRCRQPRGLNRFRPSESTRRAS